MTPSAPPSIPAIRALCLFLCAAPFQLTYDAVLHQLEFPGSYTDVCCRRAAVGGVVCLWAGVLGALDSTEEPNTGVKGMRQAGLCVFSPK